MSDRVATRPANELRAQAERQPVKRCPSLRGRQLWKEIVDEPLREMRLAGCCRMAVIRNRPLTILVHRQACP